LGETLLPRSEFQKTVERTLSVVRDNPARNRFELELDGDVAFASYQPSDGELTIFHTEVPLRLRERGIGSRLVEGVLEEARRRGHKVVPMCSFVRSFIDRHPEYRDLVQAGQH
jgi:uncharacterized protein